MLHSLLQKVSESHSFPEAQAHCDIPCKIYDPSHAIVACLSMIRMTDLILENEGKTNTIIRLMAEKEKEGQILKEEVRIIWGDYFKAPQIEQFPDVHSLVHTIMMQASKVKQEVTKEVALELLESVNTFAEYFWKSKGVATKRVVCPYPPSLPVVVADLPAA
jgi:nickel superoxide dismutase